MFSGLFGKGDKDGKAPPKDAVPARGLEVIEDDPDTAWGLWDSALAEQDSRFQQEATAPASAAVPLAGADNPLPTLEIDIGNATTQPTALEDMTPEQRKEAALKIVESHHQRIANTIRTLWGYKECSVYINKLIMNGGDGMGKSRIGFNQEAAEAMLVLADIHDSLYGANVDAGLDFVETTRGGTNWGKLR